MPSPYLPPEILDQIVDNLSNESKTLQNYCLVAKSWVPRTRKHLFADVKLSSSKVLQSWKETFPDPSNSPAYHTRTLSISCSRRVTAADMEEGGWIKTFSRVVHLEVDSKQNSNDSGISLTPFHGLSPVVKSLCVTSVRLPHLRVFGLVRSLPHLEDLTLIAHGIANDGPDVHDGPPIAIPPPSSPPFTGTLRLILLGGMEPAARRLLDLPNGLRFRNLILPWLQENDILWINGLIVGCSDTLRGLYLTNHVIGSPTRFSIDLSKATRLKDIKFLSRPLSPQWIIAALHTVTPKHRDLQGISLPVSHRFNCGANIKRTIGDTIYEQWLNLDRLLVGFWESHYIRPKLVYTCTPRDDMKVVVEGVSCLLPEITKRGIIDLVEIE